MIGYNTFRATRYYHKVHADIVTNSACANRAWMSYRYDDDQEEALKKAAPDLSRCRRCWKGEK